AGAPTCRAPAPGSPGLQALEERGEIAEIAADGGRGGGGRAPVDGAGVEHAARADADRAGDVVRLAVTDVDDRGDRDAEAVGGRLEDARARLAGAHLVREDQHVEEPQEIVPAQQLPELFAGRDD